MRFCLVSTQQHWGGGEALLWSISGQLKKFGHSVGWVTRSNSEVADHLEREGAVVLHRTHGRGRNFRDWLATREALSQWSPDVVVLNDTHAVLLAGSAALCCRSRPIRIAYKHTVFPLRSRLKYQLLSDKLVCVSKSAHDTVSKGGLAEKHLEMIYGGCERPVVRQDARELIRAEFGLDDSTKLIVAVGNLLECKGHIDLIESIHLLDSSHKIRVLIAGQGENHDRIYSRIEQLHLSDRVQLLGYRTDANELLAAADLVVHPSHAEGLSLVLIQAQMLSKPIVATPVGGASEVLDADDDRRSCWLAQPQQPESLSTAIDCALVELRDPSPEWLSRLDETTKRTHRIFAIERIAVQLADLAAQLITSQEN